MAAGMGTRMRSSLPKVAHPIAGRPLVRHVVEAARDAGVDDIVVVVGEGEGAEAVRVAAGDGVRFAVQSPPRGTAHAVECARDAAGDATHILILNGDVPLVLPETLRRLMAALDAPAAPPLALLTADVPVEAYGYLELEGDRVRRIVETKQTAGLDRTAVMPISAGQYAARASWLWSRLPCIEPAPNGERYLTALAALAHADSTPALAVRASEPDEVRGINDRVQLAEAEAIMRARIRRAHMRAGVTIVDPATTYIDAGVTIAPDTTLEPNTYLHGRTRVGARCTIGPGSLLRDATVGDGCVVRFSTVEESVLEDGVDMGPYSHLRPGSLIGRGVHIGNFAEVNRSRLGAGTKMGHFSYIGDAEVGEGVNIGAGTITANYDGVRKNRTVIGDGAFIGSDSILVAPVTIGRGARTSAGAVVTRDVPDGMMAVGAPSRLRAPSAVVAAPDASSEASREDAPPA
jgi:bifunctional UDP-N-acetylglucosamine pyrophosphorylase/glucosamine-1-phosphate N-acetyltransferase